MKRYFKEQPFYLWAVGTGMLVGSYLMFYLLIRPDLYHVPIVASAMFATGDSWLYLAGLNRPEKRAVQVLGLRLMAHNALRFGSL